MATLKVIFFFHCYRYYLQIVASSDSAERQLKWAGMVESRLRQLVMKLEVVENLALAHPFVKSFDKKTLCNEITFGCFNSLNSYV